MNHLGESDLGHGWTLYFHNSGVISVLFYLFYYGDTLPILTIKIGNWWIGNESLSLSGNKMFIGVGLL